MKFAVIGAGCGGQSMSVRLTNQGAEVALSDCNAEVVSRLQEEGAIRLSGKIEETASPALVTADNAEAVQDADVVMIVTTVDAHDAVAASIAGSLRDGQIVVLNPGMFLGSVAFRAALERAGCRAAVTIAETADLMYTCRRAPDGSIFHSALKKTMKLAAESAGKTDAVLDVLRPWFPCLVKADSILVTGLSGLGSVLHCVPMLMNANRIDCGERFEYYVDGITPSVARICETVDRERVALAAALGVQALTVVESMQRTYGMEGDDLYTTVTGNPAYAGILAPTSMKHRFCHEDTYGSLVAFAAVADVIGMPVPGMKAVVGCISMATGIDYASIGRNAEKMGLAGKTAEEIRRMVD